MTNPRTIFLSLAVLAAVAFFASRGAGHECGTVVVMPNPSSPPNAIDRELIHLAGDPDQGVSASIDLTQGKIGSPVCYYEIGGEPVLMTIDVYQHPGQPLLLHILCPHCAARGHDKQALHLRSDQKAMDYAPWESPPTFPGWSRSQMAAKWPARPGVGIAGGVLTVAEFRCTWDVHPHHQAIVGKVCDFKALIDRNRVRRA